MIKLSTLIRLLALFNAVEASPHKLQARDCAITWPAYAGDTCTTFADLWSISEDQFLSYNSGAVCSALEIGKEYCVEWTSTPPPLPTKPTQTPTPVVTPNPTTLSTATTTKAPIAACASTPAGVVAPSPIQVCGFNLHYSTQTLIQQRQE
jgi:hypothetical protein